MRDTRAEIARVLEKFEFRSGQNLIKFLGCAAAAWAMVFLPEFEGMPDSARMALGIVTLGAGLWITEAIPAFAVALLVIGLQVLILGRPGGVLADEDETKAWEAYVHPWSSPPMWLFFGGLVLARAAQRTALDRWVAGGVLRMTDGKPRLLLPSIMAVTFVFSMFMSNTATCAMMLTVLTPALLALPKDSQVAKSLLLGMAFAANLGGMVTMIGTPPNAIGAGLIDDFGRVSFLTWMTYGFPPSIALVALIWFILSRPLKGEAGEQSLLLPTGSEGSAADGPALAVWQRWLTLIVFALTIGLWMTGTLHGLPTAVVSFLPIVVLSMIGVMRAEDIRSLNWDVLILLAGGLSLGVGIESSGLAGWLADQLSDIQIPAWAVALLLSYLAAIASNLMSNTAAANILLPIGLVIAQATGGTEAIRGVIVPICLSCSIAMALPIATPPNALVYASGRLTARDYLPGGLLAVLLGPPISVFWVAFLT